MHPTGFTFSRDDQTPSKTAINFSCRNYETMICDSFNESFGIFAPMVRGDIADGFDIKGKFEFRSSNKKNFFQIHLALLLLLFCLIAYANFLEHAWLICKVSNYRDMQLRSKLFQRPSCSVTWNLDNLFLLLFIVFHESFTNFTISKKVQFPKEQSWPQKSLTSFTLASAANTISTGFLMWVHPSVSPLFSVKINKLWNSSRRVFKVNVP